MRVVCLLTLLLSTVARGADPPVTLEQLLESARSRNQDLAAAWKRVDEARALRTQAALRPVQSIGVSGGDGSLTANSGDSEVATDYTLPVELGGKRKARITLADAEVDLSTTAAEDQIRQLTYMVKVRYGHAVAEQIRLDVTRRLLAVLRQDLTIAVARVSQGDLSELSRRLLETEVARLDATLRLQSGRLDSALLELRQLTRWPDTSPLPLAANLQPSDRVPPLDPLIDCALAGRPDLRLARQSVVRHQREESLARADGYPTLQTGARFVWDRSTFNQLGYTPNGGGLSPIRDQGQILTFGVTIPLTTPRRTAGLQQAALARAEAMRLQTGQLEAAISARVAAAHTRALAAAGASTVFDDQVLRQAEANLNVVRQAFQLGELKIQDVLFEQRRYLDLELTRVQVRLDSFLAVSDLELEVGGPLP